MLDNWTEETIEKVFEVSSGLGLTEARFRPGIYYVYGGNGIIGFHNDFTHRSSELIIGRVGAHCGNVYITKKFSWITDNALIISFFKKGVSYKFWYYLLSYLKLRDYAFQSAQPVLTGGILKSIKLYYPPLPQQRKIARILSTCDAVIEKTEAAIAKYEAIKQGLMQDLFTRGVDVKTGRLRPKYEEAPERYKESVLGWIPREWEVAAVDDLVYLRHGYQFRDYDFVNEEGIEVVKIGQIGTNGNIVLEGASKIGIKRFSEFKDIQLFNGDVLMALTGATLGKTALIRNIERPLLQNYRVGYFTPKDDKVLNKHFLYFLLIGDIVQNEILGFVNAGAQGNIGKADFEKISIAVPNSIIEQEKITEKLISIELKLQTERSTLSKYRQLKAGLMQDLLTGRVAVKVEEEIESS